MKLEQQLLNIEQVQELKKLGFDVNKYASVEVNITENGNKFIISKEFIKLFPKFGDDNVIKRYYSMTIGDIIEVLPKEISIVNKDIPLKLRTDMKSYLRYSSVNYIISIKQTETFINRLFETLKLCIKEKHIAL